MSNPPSSLRELARRIAAYRALDLTVFEHLGQFATTTHGAPLARHLAAWANHHAWHAQLWTDRLPRIAGIDVDTADADPMVPTPVEVADALSSDDDPLWVVRQYVDRVLVPLATTLAAHRDATDDLLDAPTGRVLDLVLGDIHTDHAAATSLLSPTEQSA